ncbi:hypothetical protein VT84_18965 [Gemmata sp. SH-PL17]|nr:hypothetical protein VT84_18965 [Gemmata sp. SH-PL17]
MNLRMRVALVDFADFNLEPTNVISEVRNKKIPPEVATASPIHCRYQPAGHWNNTPGFLREQLIVSVFSAWLSDTVSYSDKWS